MSSNEPVSINERAAENLVFIRKTMSRAGPFTAVPGTGGVVMGLIGLAAAIIAPFQNSPSAWLVTWLVAAFFAVASGTIAMVIKIHRSGLALFSPPARRFLLGFSPGIIAGALLTLALYEAGLHHLLPATWLLLYGVSVVAGGAFSVPAIPLMGFIFLLLGAIALFTPPIVGAICLGLGFGLLHVVFGFVVRRDYGG